MKQSEPCRRRTGSYRAHFTSREAAETFASDPANPAYSGDVAHECVKCGWWHLSRIEWLVPEFARRMTRVN
jgi:hypothetical protein